MSFFVDYNFFNPKVKLLSDRYDLIRGEYLSNRDKLEFKDFTKQQDENILEYGKGYPIGVENYFTAPKKMDKNGCTKCNSNLNELTVRKVRNKGGLLLSNLISVCYKCS